LEDKFIPSDSHNDTCYLSSDLPCKGQACKIVIDRAENNGL
jgi:hypothetical protein